MRMQTLLKTPEQKFIWIASTLLLLIAGLFIFDAGHAYSSTTFVDAIPPEEFMTTAVDAAAVAGDRRPSNTPISVSEIVKGPRKYSELSRPERRSLYNAVMYFCNEEKDDDACNTYINYCGKTCQLLVQGPSASR